MGAASENLEVSVRAYRSGDAAATLKVFLDAVTVTAAADYAPEQIAAWARPAHREIPEWNRARSRHRCFVAQTEGSIAGFADLGDCGYIDMIFVAPQYSRRGVATALLAVLEAKAREESAPQLSADVSITARPFFERHGFRVEAVQQPVMAGVVLRNFRMVRGLDL